MIQDKEKEVNPLCISIRKTFAAFGYIIVPAHEENLSPLSYVQRRGYNDLEKQLEENT